MHALISLSSDQSISEVMQLIKGEAAHWANRQGLFPGKLEWGDEYFAESVSHSQLQNVRAYIANQEEHHRKMTFGEEYDEFIRKNPGNRDV
jgi:putative transposase